MRPVFDFLPKNTKSKNQTSINQKSHFKTRFYERVGERCSESIYQELKSQINGAEPYRNNNPQRPIYLLSYKNFQVKVIYDKNTKSLVTII